MRLHLRLLILLVLVMILAACASPMSQEEARQVTLSTARPAPLVPQQRSFTPPPRSIRDILKVLEQPGLSDPERLARLSYEANLQLPSIETDGYLAEFYFRKGNAANSLGWDWQALQNHRLAFDHMQKAGEERLDILRSLASAEQTLGNLRQAVALLERCRAIDDASVTHEYSQDYDQRLLPLYLSMGDLPAAGQALEKGRFFCSHEIIRGTRYSYTPWGRINSQWDKQRKAANCAQMEARFAESEQRFSEAESHWRLQLEKRVEIGEPGNTIGARLNLAENLRRQGRLPEAEMEVRKALGEAVAYGGRDSIATLNAARVLARILREQGRREDSEKLSRAVVLIMEELGIPDNAQRMYDARMLYGEILLRGDHDRLAKEQFDRAKAGLKKAPGGLRKLATAPVILAAIRAGALGEATELIQTALGIDREAYGQAHERIAQLMGLRAMTHAARGEIQNALRDFAAALPLLMGEGRGFISRTVLEGYVDFLCRLAGTPDENRLPFEPSTDAFVLADQLGQGTTEAALNEACARLASASDPSLESLSRKDQELQTRIAALETALAESLGLPPQEQDHTLVESHIRALVKLKEEREILWRRISASFPQYMKWIHPETVTLEKVQKNLRSGEALILIHPAKEQTFVWAVPKQGKASFARSLLGKEEIEAAVGQVRRSLDIRPRRIGEIPSFNLAKAHELYRTLLQPVEAGWKGASDLIVIAKGPLGQLPLALLPTEAVDPATFAEHRGGHFGGYRDAPWLIRQASLTTLPSVASLVNLRSISPGDPGRKAFAGFGDPFFNREQHAQAGGLHNAVAQSPKPERAGLETPMAVRGIRLSEKGSLDSEQIQTSQIESLERLPDTTEEIAAIAAVLGADPQRDVFLGRDASENRVKTMDLFDRKVVAFATHALVPRDLDGLEQPALALSSPSVTGEEGDGLLTMEEILHMRLNADWVVLSGCNTGAASGTGAEAVSGLGGAFFYAGARALLASMWPLETTSGRKLATGIFQAQQEDPTLSRAQAVRKSMLALMDKGSLIDEASRRIAASYAHPFFWASFILVGDGR